MSAGAVAGGVVGGVIGFFVGGPAGAAIGFGIGMSAGGMLDPVKGPSQPGPQINDKNFQTAKYGDMLSRFYGTVPVFGNVTWIEGGKLKVVFRKKKSGGKGGSAKAAPVAYYSATFFLSLGLGPIAGIRRIWCSDKLIYNAGSDDLETIIASNQAATGFKVYLGTDDQLPDPRYEADVGVGNASAYRGEAYIAFYDFQLADFGNTLQGAQFKVEVVTQTQYGDMVLAAFSPQADIRHPIYSPSSSTDAVRTYVGSASADSWSVFDHILGNKIYRGVLDRTGYKGDPPRRVVGNLVNLQVASFNTGFLVDGALFATSKFGGGWTNYDIVYDSGSASVYALGRGSGGTTKLVLTKGGGVEFEAASTGIRSIAMGEGALYGITTTAILTLDLEDLTQLASVPITPVYAVPSNDGVYISYSAGKIYLFPYLNAPTADAKVLQIFDALTGALIAAETGMPDAGYTSSRGGPSAIYDGVIFQCALGGSEGIRYITYDQMLPGTIPLSSIVTNEIELSSLLTAADVNVLALTDQVRGYRVSGGSIRSTLEPLQGAFPFDIIQSGYQLKCVPRGQASVMTIPWEDLGAAEGDTPGDLLQESREMDSQLPALVAVKYLDAAREYAVGEQSKARINTQAINRVDREVSLVLTADEAAAMADVLVNLPWLERTPAKFTLPPTYLALEPADVVTVVTQDATHEFRLTDINYTPDGRLECEAKPNRAALYTSNAKGGEGVPPGGTIGISGPSLWVALDIPTIDEAVQNSPGFATAATGYTERWPGCVLFRSPDAGQTWQELQAYQGKATIGACLNALGSDPGYVIDRASVLTVELVSGELESITETQMLNGQNVFAYGADGRWELIMAANCVLQADGSYQLSTLVRGWKGTEWATGLHVAGDVLVLLDDPDNLFIDMAVAGIGTALSYRAVTSGAVIDSALDQPFTYQGVNLKPLSVVNVTGTRDGSQNLSIDAVRRSRLSSNWWVTGVPAPVGETSESYQIDVMSGSTVKRTLAGTSFPISYSAADQTSDFGSPQASVTLNIYQLSGVVGRGYARNATV